MNITVLGLVFDIVGALFLGYEIVVHPLVVNTTYLAERQIDFARNSYERLIEETTRLPPENFALEQKEERVEYLQGRLDERIDQALKQVPPVERNRVRYGAIGLGLLITGFLLQAIGAAS